MLREANNKILCNGILSECNLKYSSYVKDGKTCEVINGGIKVLVEQVINGVPETSEIEFDAFANKYKKGTREINPSYASLEKCMNEMTSIAAAGSKDGADRIKVGGAKFVMNEFVGRDGNIVVTPRLSFSFVERVVGKFEPMTKFFVEGVVGSIIYAVDKDGEEIEPRKLLVNLVVPGWQNRVDIFQFSTQNPEYISSIEQNWEPNSSVEIRGKLSCTTSTEIVTKSKGFGEPEEFVRTHVTRDFVITGGSEEPYDEENEFNLDEIRAGLAERKNRQAAILAKGANAKSAPAPKTTARAAALDLGF